MNKYTTEKSVDIDVTILISNRFYLEHIVVSALNLQNRVAIFVMTCYCSLSNGRYRKFWCRAVVTRDLFFVAALDCTVLYYKVFYLVFVKF